MKEKLLCLLCITLLLVSCNNGSSNKDSDVSRYGISFNQMLDDYYEEYLRLYPLWATTLGDNRYNDTLPDFLSDEFISSEKSFYAKYKELAGKDLK